VRVGLPEQSRLYPSGSIILHVRQNMRIEPKARQESASENRPSGRMFIHENRRSPENSENGEAGTVIS
jgi:hypothetical protein